MSDRRSLESLVLLPRESHPRGGVSSHIETLMRALSPKVTYAYWHLPPVGTAQKLLLLARHLGDVPTARQTNVLRKVIHLREQVRVRAQAWPSARLIHTHDALAGLAAVTFRDRARRPLPVLHTAHGPLSREIRMDMGDERLADFIEQLEREFYSRVDRVVAVDAGQAEILVKDFGMSRGKITVIHNAVDVGHVGPPTPDLRIERGPVRRVLLLPRRLVEKNGPEVAVAAVRHLPEDHHLWIVGDGPLRSRLQAQVNALGLQRRVRWWGEQPRPNVIALMREADVVLVPSVPAHGVVEATSIAALEGMALGKPVVASAIGGLAELIRSGENGILVPPGDPTAVARAVRALDDPIWRQGIESRALDFVQREWATEGWASRVYAEYQRVW